MLAQDATIRAATSAAAPERSGLGALPMMASGLGSLAHGLARAALLLMREVAERDDADEALLAVHDRQPPHLHLAHVLRHAVELLVLVAVQHLVGAHHLAHRRVGPQALRHRAHRDVA